MFIFQLYVQLVVYERKSAAPIMLPISLWEIASPQKEDKRGQWGPVVSQGSEMELESNNKKVNTHLDERATAGLSHLSLSRLLSLNVPSTSDDSDGFVHL